MAKTESKIAAIKDALFPSADTVGKNKAGNYVARRGFFYTHGMDGASFAQTIEALLRKAGIQAKVINSGEKWASFRGGASIAASSHFWAEISLDDDHGQQTRQNSE